MHSYSKTRSKIPPVKIFPLYFHNKTSSNKLSEFLRRSSLIFIIKVFRTIVFIFIVISTTFRPICPPGFFRCLSNLGNFKELRTTSFIETTGVACSDSVCHDRAQVLSIPVLLLACGNNNKDEDNSPKNLNDSSNKFLLQNSFQHISIVNIFQCILRVQPFQMDSCSKMISDTFH